MSAAVPKLASGVGKMLRNVAKSIRESDPKWQAQQLRNEQRAVAMERESFQRQQAEGMAATRRVRRGARSLLSEARLSPEEGIGQSTLGSGPM